MARKKKNDSAAAGLGLIIAIVLILTVLLTPIVLFFGYLYNRLKFNEIKKKLNRSVSYFWLDDVEKKQFKHDLKELSGVIDVIEQANQKGEKAGISKNQDGSWSARSNLGKEIRGTLERYEPLKEDLVSVLIELQSLPIKRWEQFNLYGKRANSFLMAFYVWIGSVVWYAIVLGRYNVREALLPYYVLATNFFKEEGTRIKLTGEDLKMFAVATLISIVTYFIGGLVFKRRGEKFSPVPPEVTLENVDSY